MQNREFGSLCRKGKHREFCYNAGKVGNTGKIFWLWSPIWKVHVFIYFYKFQKKLLKFTSIPFGLCINWLTQDSSFMRYYCNCNTKDPFEDCDWLLAKYNHTICAQSNVHQNETIVGNALISGSSKWHTVATVEEWIISAENKHESISMFTRILWQPHFQRTSKIHT